MADGKQTTRWLDRTLTVTYGQIVTFAATWTALDLIKITLEHLL